MAPKRRQQKPKRGTLRRTLRPAVIKEEATRTRVRKKPAAAAAVAKPDYVPEHQQKDDAKSTRDVTWSNTETTLDDLLGMSEKNLIQALWKGDHRQKQKTCTHCGQASLGKFKLQRVKWQWRCGRNQCHKFVLPVAGSLVFHTQTPLREQVGSLFCAAWGVQIGLVPALVRGATGNVTRRVYADWH